MKVTNNIRCVKTINKMAMNTIMGLSLLISLNSFSALPVEKEPTNSQPIDLLTYNTDIIPDKVFLYDSGLEAWEERGYKNVSIQDYTPTSKNNFYTPIDYTFSMEAVILEGSGWSIQEVKHRLNKVKHVFLQCGVSIENVTIISAKAQDDKYLDMDNTHDEQELIDLIFLSPPVKKVRLHYIRNLSYVGSATSGPKWFYEPDANHPMLNTAWISRRVIKWEANQRDKDPNFTIDAHELGHIILNHNHDTNDRNLMKTKSTQIFIPKEQCEKLRNSEYVQKI